MLYLKWVGFCISSENPSHLTIMSRSSLIHRLQQAGLLLCHGRSATGSEHLLRKTKVCNLARLRSFERSDLVDRYPSSSLRRSDRNVSVVSQYMMPYWKSGSSKF